MIKVNFELSVYYFMHEGGGREAWNILRRIESPMAVCII